MKKVVLIILTIFSFNSAAYTEEPKPTPEPETIMLDSGRQLKKTFYENGQLRTMRMYKDKKLDGISKVFYKNGEVAYIDTYVNGEKSKRIAYDQYGRLKFEQDYPIMAQLASTLPPLVPPPSTVQTSNEPSDLKQATPQTKEGKALDDISVGDGTYSLGLAANFTSSDGINSGGLGVSVSRFISDYFFPGISLSFSLAEDYTNLALGFPLRAVFNQRNRFLPFIGFTPGLWYVKIGSDSETSFYLDVSVGFAYILVKHVGLTAHFAYQRVFLGSGFNIFTVPVGLAFYF